MEKQLMSGNEALAQGAWEAGVAVGAGYPGTPSTEVLESLVTYDGTICEWSPNEKVAFEVAHGASIGGVRSIVTMKHVGVNVAADPLMSAANTGVNGGFVLVAADDPSCYSSQNEQDSRYYAAFARIPCLTPSDSQEAYEMAQEAFELSERFDAPVMFHETMRVAHTRTLVEFAGSRSEVEPRRFEDDIPKYVMIPANAVKARVRTDERERKLREFAENTALNRIELRDRSMGVICAGAVYQHVREALPEASTLKLGLTWPLPAAKIAEFAESVDACYVVEEASPYLRDIVLAGGVELADPPAGPLPIAGELTPAKIAAAFGVGLPGHAELAEGLPPRPPALCPGCPHRPVFCELRRAHAIVMGDIGCYALGAVPPYNALHSCIDMGSSISLAHGMELAGAPSREGRPVVGVIGDSTFAHSGITSLLDTVYNGGAGTILILDNRTTAMTGTQGNPVNGLTLAEQAARVSPLLDASAKPSLDVPAGVPLDLETLCRAMGIEDVVTVDPQSFKEVRSALREATSKADELSVIICKSPCQLALRRRGPIPQIEGCRRCGACLQIGCPALHKAEDGRAEIDEELCVGCGQCAQSCPYGCIQEVEDE